MGLLPVDAFMREHFALPREAGHTLIVIGCFASLMGCSGSSGPTDVTRPPVDGVALSLGGVRTTNAIDPTCPQGSVCQAIEVTCEKVSETAAAFVAVSDPSGVPRGIVVFTTGSGGENWALEGGERRAFLTQLLADGFRVVQLRWASNWLVSSPGNDAGTARLACRPATAFNWIYQVHFRPLGIARSSNGRCGFCITGNSGGATQVSFSLSHYGLDEVLDAVVPTGGPPHAALAKACLRKPGEEGFWYSEDTRAFLDRGFGFFDGSGPCVRNDAAFTDRWNAESIATGGSDYFHPRTRVHFIRGAEDPGQQAPSEFYAARLLAGGSPWVTVQIAPNTPHGVLGTAEGRSAVRAALLGSR